MVVMQMENHAVEKTGTGYPTFGIVPKASLLAALSKILRWMILTFPRLMR